jgi:hypothetical protein
MKERKEKICLELTQSEFSTMFNAVAQGVQHAHYLNRNLKKAGSEALQDDVGVIFRRFEAINSAKKKLIDVCPDEWTMKINELNIKVVADPECDGFTEGDE